MNDEEIIEKDYARYSEQEDCFNNGKQEGRKQMRQEIKEKIKEERKKINQTSSVDVINTIYLLNDKTKKIICEFLERLLEEIENEQQRDERRIL